MSDWWTYTLSDLQIFSARAYARLFEVYNAEIFPAQIVSFLLGLLVLRLLARPGRRAGRAAAAILAVCWLWVALAFHLLRFSSIHWAGQYFAAACVLEAALLAWFGAAGRPAVGPRTGGRPRAGMGVFLFALILQPLAGPILGRGWRGIEIFGVAPDPTAVATIGVGLVGTGKARWVLLAIPAAWCAISGATLLATGVPVGWVTPAAAAAALLLAVVGRRRPVDSDGGRSPAAGAG